MPQARGVRRYESPREKYGRGCILFSAGLSGEKAKSLERELRQKLKADDLIVYHSFNEEFLTRLIKDWYEKGIRELFIAIAGTLSPQVIHDLLPGTLSNIRETALDIDLHFAAIKKNFM